MPSRRRKPRQHVCEPVPVAYLNAVLESFWGEYAGRRNVGMEPDEAVMGALEGLLPLGELEDVERMLSGDFDEEFSIDVPFDGRLMLRGLIETGDHYVEVEGL